MTLDLDKSQLLLVLAAVGPCYACFLLRKYFYRMMLGIETALQEMTGLIFGMPDAKVSWLFLTWILSSFALGYYFELKNLSNETSDKFLHLSTIFYVSSIIFTAFLIVSMIVVGGVAVGEKRKEESKITR